MNVAVPFEPTPIGQVCKHRFYVLGNILGVLFREIDTEFGQINHVLFPGRNQDDVVYQCVETDILIRL